MCLLTPGSSRSVLKKNIYNKNKLIYGKALIVFLYDIIQAGFIIGIVMSSFFYLSDNAATIMPGLLDLCNCTQ
jgi:hypothetical protein